MKKIIEFQDFMIASGYEIPHEEYPQLAQPKVMYDLRGGSRLVVHCKRDEITGLIRPYRKPVKVIIIVEEVEE